MVASTAILMALHPSVPADTVRGLIEAAKTRPQMIANYGSAGTGTVFHLTGELFKQLAGLQLQHVPYRGGAPTVSALLAGEIPLAFETMLVLQPHVRAGTLRALAVTSPAAQRYHARHPDHCGGRVPGVGCGQFVRPVCTLRNARPSGRDDAGATPSTTALPATFDEYDSARIWQQWLSRWAAEAGSAGVGLLHPHAPPSASRPDRLSLHNRERGSPMKNRKRQICTSGSVSDEDGPPPHLPGRRKFLHIAAGAAVFSTASHVARAQAYPSRPITIVVGYARRRPD
jgi:hypothetical protein